MSCVTSVWAMFVRPSITLPFIARVFISRTVSNALRTMSLTSSTEASDAATLGPSMSCSSSSATVRTGRESGAKAGMAALTQACARSVTPLSSGHFDGDRPVADVVEVAATELLVVPFVDIAGAGLKSYRIGVISIGKETLHLPFVWS